MYGGAGCTNGSLVVDPAVAELASDLRRLIREGGWRFSKPANPKLANWALGQPRVEVTDG
jgi:hypothetical protein